MIAFLPIARYRVEYQVASGRPFSSFERLLLRAVHDKHDTVPALAQLFAIHNRLIIEGLVTLMQAGWVSLNAGEDRFVLSASGIEACAGSGLPPTIAVSDRSSTIIMEKLTGQVARNNEVEFHLRKKLEALWKTGVPLRPADISNIIEPALISPLLSHQSTEWIRWIGPITVLSDNAAFALIDVNTNTERIAGVPKSWEALLLPECLDRVRARERVLAARGVEVSDRELRQLVRREELAAHEDEGGPEVDPQWSPLNIRQNDVLRSSDEHRVALQELVGGATAYVAIACTNLSETGMPSLVPILTDAVNRGIVVNVFLGYMPRKENAEAWAGFELLKKLEYDSARHLSGGRFVMGTLGTECSTDIALADTGAGAAAILGSYRWGGSRPNSQHLSLRLTNPWIVARLCEILAGFSSADERLRIGAGLVRLKKAAGELRQQVQSSERVAAGTLPREARAQLLLDKDHAEAIHSVTSGAQRTVSIFTDDLVAFSRAGWLRFLQDPAERLGPGVRIVFGSPKNVDFRELPLLEDVIKNGASIERRDVPGGIVVIADDSRLVVTSSASALTSARRSYSSRIGIAMIDAEEPIALLNLG